MRALLALRADVGAHADHRLFADVAVATCSGQAKQGNMLSFERRPSPAKDPTNAGEGAAL